MNTKQYQANRWTKTVECDNCHSTQIISFFDLIDHSEENPLIPGEWIQYYTCKKCNRHIEIKDYPLDLLKIYREMMPITVGLKNS